MPRINPRKSKSSKVQISAVMNEGNPHLSSVEEEDAENSIEGQLK